jgi:riboflavin synthase
MFTGIIQEIGKIEKLTSFGGGLKIRVLAPRCSAELKINDSVAINGVCQTVVRRSERNFEVEVVEETLKKTTLGQLKVGDRINLELPLRLGERLGGHLVLGHVDAVGTVCGIKKQESSWIFSVRVPSQYLRYIVDRGSITVDGVSLTIARSEGDTIFLSIIPHTWDNTTFQNLRPGSTVNLEFDVLAKFVEKLMNRSPNEVSGKIFPDEAQLRNMRY